MAPAAVLRSAPTVRLAASGGATGATARVVTNPGCRDGELLIAIQSQKGGTAAAMTAPSAAGFAWAQRGADGGSVSVGFMKVWYRTASTEGLNWSFTGDGDGVVSVLVVPNWDTRGDGFLWDGEPVFTTGLTAGGATQAHAGLTMARSLNRLINAYASFTGGGTHLPPATYTEHTDTAVVGSHNHAVNSAPTAGAGTTGAISSVASVAENWVAVAFALSSPPDEATSSGAPSVSLPHWSTAANTLVALVAANSTGQDGASNCMISSVIDDAHNTWVEGPTDFVTGFSGEPTTAVRLSIWYCTGAAAITGVTATATEICDSMAIQILEASGVTNVSPLDIFAHGQNNNVINVDAAGTTLNASDLIVAGAATGNSNRTLTHTADTWTTITDATSSGGGTSDNDVLLRGAYKVLAATGAQTTRWVVSPTGAGVWGLLALKGGSVVTTNPNANWPQMTHQLGFGVDPNNPAAAASWTTVTNRVLSFSTRRGRDYELTRTEAGEADVRMRNDDGALDPSNTGSAYSPNVKVFTPYRIRAVWNGNTYPIFTGYVERWPQQWDDEYGTSPMVAVDGFATLSATRLTGTLGSEILADVPYAYWPLDDGRLSRTAANQSTVTTNVLTAVDSAPVGGDGFMGSDLNLQSEESTCWEETRFDETAGTPNSTGGTCLTAQMTLPTLSSGLLVECWAKIKSIVTIQNYGLMAIKATASAEAHKVVALVRMDASNGAVTVDVATLGGTLTAFPTSASGLNDNKFHHYVLHLTSGPRVRLWVDGSLVLDAVPASVPSSTPDRIFIGGMSDEYNDQNFAVGLFAHVAVFQLAVVDERRISMRANAGLFGFPEKSGARMSRLLNYADWTAGRAIDTGLSLLGAASTIANQTLLAAVQDVASWENGVVFVDAAGNFRFVARDTHFNQDTKWVFGENTAAGEIPYETDVQIDYDPKYVFNDVTITRGSGTVVSSTGVSGNTGSGAAHKRDQASILTYFTRSMDKTSGVASISQCLSEATWVLENYAQPRLRLSRISITPSANPSLWPVALSAEVGDRVTVMRRPFNGGAVITLDCYIEQIHHQVMPNKWEVTFTLSPVLLTTYAGETGWILGLSTLDIDTIMGV